MLFIYSFSKCLLSVYCVLGTFLGSEDVAVNKTKNPNLMEFTFYRVQLETLLLFLVFQKFYCFCILNYVFAVSNLVHLTFDIIVYIFT